MSNDEQSIESLIQEETEKRIETMEDKSYTFPETIRKGDIIGIIVCIAVCLLLILLCMTGVIA